MNTYSITHCCATWIATSALVSALTLDVTAVNPLDTPRTSETLELSSKDLALLGELDFSKIHIRDASGSELMCQAIDQDGDELRKPDAVIFQSDFAAGETKHFTVSGGAKQVFKKEQYKAFGRFVRERFDDFAWENDKIAHRTYGKALETWKGEPLTSSTIDIWSKRTPHMIVNDWYLADDYHADHGDGADFYSAGASRGCGGSGIWAANQLWVSKNFVASRVLANGPIRVMFELEYEAYPVNGVPVSEVKRITLDAGKQLDCYQSRYQGSTSLSTAVGLKKNANEKTESGEGWMTKWEPMEKKAGEQGLAVIVRPVDFATQTQDPLNHLTVLKPSSDGVATWWAGFCWNKAGDITTADAWKKYVATFARCIATPIHLEVKVSK